MVNITYHNVTCLSPVRRKNMYRQSLYSFLSSEAAFIQMSMVYYSCLKAWKAHYATCATIDRYDCNDL